MCFTLKFKFLVTVDVPSAVIQGIALLVCLVFLCNEYFLSKKVVGIKNDTYICTDTKVV